MQLSSTDCDPPDNSKTESYRKFNLEPKCLCLQNSLDFEISIFGTSDSKEQKIRKISNCHMRGYRIVVATRIS